VADSVVVERVAGFVESGIGLGCVDGTVEGCVALAGFGGRIL
jgi:hypothetical protein